MDGEEPMGEWLLNFLFENGWLFGVAGIVLWPPAALAFDCNGRKAAERRARQLLARASHRALLGF